ncbi:MAG: hypothetical protein J2P45_27855 [Candidatus Dormibacteraeota bacterium]|nr:hypothetical protein [Candidatus Dormibacteraeota bacterium]
MPPDMDHPPTFSRERYRFHPWYERPLSEQQIFRLWLAAVGVALAAVVGAALGLARMGAWPGVALAVVAIALLLWWVREGWSDVRRAPRAGGSSDGGG